MRAAWHADGSLWSLSFTLDPDDLVRGRGQGTLEVGLKATEAKVRLPRPIESPHPDLLAVAAIVVLRPWVGSRLTLSAPVSRSFAETVSHLLRFEVGPVDDALPSRTPGARPLLSYSGGADSIAASRLLPADTPHIHFRRVPHAWIPDFATHVRADAIERVVRTTGERGRDVHMVRSDIEHLCSPYPTLPSWLAIALGVYLLADDLDGGAVAMGGTLETHYMDMGRRWTGRPGAGLAPLSEAVGLPFLRPCVGLTEIGTMALTNSSDLADVSRSCVLGTLAAPCGECTKCVRKDLVVSALQGSLAPTITSLRPTAPGWRGHTGPGPFYMQAQLEYALARLDTQGTLLDDLKVRLSPEATGTEWMERYYAPAIEDAVPPRWQPVVRERVEELVGFMDEVDVGAAHAWSR